MAYQCNSTTCKKRHTCIYGYKNNRKLKYVSIDIETTGLSPENHNILEFAAVLETGAPMAELPVFRRILLWKEVTGSPFALEMNKGLLKQIANYYGKTDYDPKLFCYPDNLGRQFKQWLVEQDIDCYHVTAAGKNFEGFDRRFLDNLKGFNSSICFRHRVLDPVTLYTTINDDVPLGMEECMKRAGVDFNKYMIHSAVDDAKIVIELLRAKGL
jgi:hypothetical protein